MSKVNLGEKRQCPKCGSRFYDLGKNPTTCPKCKTVYDSTAPVKVRRKSRASVVVDADDPLLKSKAKAEAKKITKKPIKEIEGIDLTEFEDIETIDNKEEIEEIEEIEDMDSLEVIDVADDAGKDEPMDDDIALEDETGDALIDEVQDEEEAEEEEEDTRPKAKKPAARKPTPAKKAPAKKKR